MTKLGIDVDGLGEEQEEEKLHILAQFVGLAQFGQFGNCENLANTMSKSGKCSKTKCQNFLPYKCSQRELD